MIVLVSDRVENGEYCPLNLREYYVDSTADIENLPKEGIAAGSSAFVVSSGKIYILMNTAAGNKEWKGVGGNG